MELLFHFLCSLRDRLAVFCQQVALTFIFHLSVHTRLTQFNLTV
jgi:hypothetical protein